MDRTRNNTSISIPVFIRKGGWFLLLFFVIAASRSEAAFKESLWGARPAGLAGAFTAMADDANAPAYNPAGVGFLTSTELTVMYAQLFTGLDLHAGQDTSKLGLGYVSFVPQIDDKRYGSMAVSWSNFTATNLMREDTFSLTYADTFDLSGLPQHPILGLGANLKYLRHSFSIDQYSSSDPTFSNGRSKGAPTLDLGLILRPKFSFAPGFKMGLVGQNITEPNVGLSATDRVPSRYAVGFAYQDLRFRLFNPTVDIARRAGLTTVTFGVEGWMLKDSLGFRAGGNSDEIGGGLGYQFKLNDAMKMRIDYSLLWPLNVGGTNGNHRVSLTLNY